MKKAIILVASIAIMTFLAGCIGSSDDNKKEAEATVGSSSFQLTGNPTGLAQITPEKLSTTVDINLDYSNVIKISVLYSVEDGDPNTNADQVDQLALAETGEEGNYSGTGQGGNANPGTPVTGNITIEWDGTNYMMDRWSMDINVTIIAGEDQWIGPLIWRGVPDTGFSYTLDISYEYHEEMD